MPMKICKNCGTQLEDDELFCPECGTKYEEPRKSFCRKCGAKLPDGANFCIACGTPVRSRLTGSDQVQQPTRIRRKNNTEGNLILRKRQIPGAAAVPVGAVCSDIRTATNPAEVCLPPDQRSAISGDTRTATNQTLQRPALNADNQIVRSNSSFYLVDFVKPLVKVHRIPVIIYLVLNVLVIWWLFTPIFPGNAFLSFACAMACYTVSIALALSPFGEMILRWQNGCRKLEREEIIARIEPLFQEARNRAAMEARAEGLSIPDNIRLFMKDDDAPNAFATGRRTICFTKGLLYFPDDQIIATLCHEFGHIAHHDTDFLLLITVGNMIVSIIYTVIRVITKITGVFLSILMFLFGGEESLLGGLASLLVTLITVVFLDAMMWLWTGLGSLLVLKSMRSDEYKADEFAFRCGYGNPLCALLEAFSSCSYKETGLFATLASSHPSEDKRIAALQSLGATYRASF
jgi:heat shock protein HtpX